MHWRHMRSRSHGGNTWENYVTGLRTGKGMLFWISVNGLVKHGANHQRIQRERSPGLWKLLHGPHSCNGLVIWNTSRMKDYRLEFDKLNHNEIQVTQENVLLDKTKRNTMVRGGSNKKVGRLVWFGRQYPGMSQVDGIERIQRNTHGKDLFFWEEGQCEWILGKGRRQSCFNRLTLSKKLLSPKMSEELPRVTL